VHPEYGASSENEVTERPATDASDGSDQDEANKVHLLARRSQRAACRKHGDTTNIEPIENGIHDRPLRAMETGPASEGRTAPGACTVIADVRRAWPGHPTARTSLPT